jgi:hypothetical protein
MWMQGSIGAPGVPFKFCANLGERYVFTQAPAGEGGGIYLPELGVEIKILAKVWFETLHPHTNAEQRVYGLDDDLLLFVLPESWEDGAPAPNAPPEAMRVMYIAREYTGDYDVTQEIADILDHPGIRDPELRRDVLVWYLKKALSIQLQQSRLLAERVQARRPKIGAISLRPRSYWRAGFSRVLNQAEALPGVEELSAALDANQPDICT